MAKRKKKEDAKTKEFVLWLRRGYWKWQEDTGELADMSKFAAWINPKIKQPTMSRWLNSIALPTGENISRLAIKLGPEIYDILGMERPVTDPRLKGINQSWYDLPEETKNRVSEIVDRTVGRKVGDGEEASAVEPNVGVTE